MNKKYEIAVQEIESRGIMPDKVPNLDRMRQAFDLLQPHLSFDPRKTIVVAGTNGKGSVCATLEALLLSAGQRVGLYTSPHLEDTTERFRIQGQDVSKDRFCKAYEEVAALTSSLGLSHFEILTAMALWLFYKESECEWGIFEVGLGGLWDATNVIPHTTSVITSLGLDHQNLLGNTLPEIAINKFGIVHPGNQVIHAKFPAEILMTVKQVQSQVPSTWREAVSYDWSVEKNTDPEPVFSIHTRWGKSKITLAGRRGAENTALALTVFEALGFDPSKNLTSLSQVRWPSRMERIVHPEFRCPIFLSGDHNLPGVESLLELLKYYQRTHLHLICGIGKDKEAGLMLQQFFSLEAASIYLTETPFRGKSLKDYDPSVLEKAAFTDSNPLKVLTQVRSIAKEGEMVLITGSLYLTGLLRSALRV